MVNARSWRLVMAAAWCLSSGCTVHVLSPPAHSADLQSAATLQEGQVSVGGAIGAHSSEVIFDDSPRATSVDGHVGVGVIDRLEIRGGAQFVRLRSDGDGVDADRLRNRESPNITSGYLGVKGQLTPYYGRKPFVLAGELGLGGGRSAAGGFVAPDFGLVLSWENPFFVPTAAFRYARSLPVGAEEPNFDLTALDDGEGDVSRLRPQRTHVFRFTFGFKITIPMNEERGRFGRPDGSVDLHLAFVYTGLRDDEESLGFIGGIVGLEFRLPSLWGNDPAPEPSSPALDPSAPLPPPPPPPGSWDK